MPVSLKTAVGSQSWMTGAKEVRRVNLASMPCSVTGLCLNVESSIACQLITVNLKFIKNSLNKGLMQYMLWKAFLS